MRSISLLILPLVAAGCASLSVVRPDGFVETANELAIDHSFINISGTQLDGYALDASLPASTATLLGDDSSIDASNDFSILRGTARAWAVRCRSQLDSKVRPPVQLVCVHLPGSREDAPLSLSLTASTSRPLSGVFYSARGPWVVEGVSELGIGWMLPDTAGFVVRQGPGGEPLLFIDAVGTRLSAEVSPKLSADDRRALAPLILTLMAVRDARFVLRNAHGQNAFTSTDEGMVAGRVLGMSRDAVALSAVPPEFPGMTAHEVHAVRLVQRGFGDAGRALWAWLSAQRTQ